MDKQRRHLALVRLQAMITAHSRREAMRILADALETEQRKAALACRSHDLLHAAALRAGRMTGAALTARAQFAAGLGQIAAEAEAAHQDASRRADARADALAQAEARARRVADIERSAQRACVAAQDRRDEAYTTPMARKLQSERQR